MEKLFISLAYQYVMLALLVAEANHALEKLDVPGVAPITMADIAGYHISPPRLRPGGSLEITNLFLGFGENRLQFIHFTGPNAHLGIQERHDVWAKMASNVGTNEAYRLATNWLVRLEVDVAALEKAHPPQVMQQFYFRDGNTDNKINLPRFEIRWGTNHLRPAVWISVFGPTKSPLLIRQEDGSFIRRPEVIKRETIEELLAIPNKEFANWSANQKSNLVVQSGGNRYSAIILPEIVSRTEHRDSPPLPSIEQEAKDDRTKLIQTLPPKP